MVGVHAEAHLVAEPAKLGERLERLVLHSLAGLLVGRGDHTA